MTLEILENLEQRTEAWYEARRGIVTASQVWKLLTVRKLGAMDFDCPACGAEATDSCLSKRGANPAPIKTPHPERVSVAAANKKTVIEPASNDESRGLTLTLAAERIAGFTDPTFISNDMWRGITEEPYAVDAYADHRAVPVKTVGFMTEDKWGFKLGYSPDGLVGDDGLVEVKSRRGKTHVQVAVSGNVPTENMAQLQAGLLVSGREWVDYIDYCGGMHLYVIRVRPDSRWRNAIIDAVRLFEANCSEVVAQYMQAVEGFPMTEWHTELEMSL